MRVCRVPCDCTYICMFKMSVISGVISRQVLPVCGSLCFFCPALRARSRQPVKRYKKLIADIFPRTPVSIFYVHRILVLSQHYFGMWRSLKVGFCSVMTDVFFMFR